MNQTDYREIFRRMRRQGRILERMKDSALNSMLRKIARNIIGCESKIIAANESIENKLNGE